MLKHNLQPDSRLRLSRALCSGLRCLVLLAIVSMSAAVLADAIDDVQPKMVKIYGAGGFHGMEAY